MIFHHLLLSTATTKNPNINRKFSIIDTLAYTTEEPITVNYRQRTVNS